MLGYVRLGKGGSNDPQSVPTILRPVSQLIRVGIKV